ncbi:hypothetical protein V5799_026497 [Amblyomma americanum]|uniref:Peptidase M13 N-terminal domain-containing protein n=1 Tax=Amblyomma americanum TaxID=6943 RepID=A0AAQ4DIE3_AMBAM
MLRKPSVSDEPKTEAAKEHVATTIRHASEAAAKRHWKGAIIIVLVFLSVLAATLLAYLVVMHHASDATTSKGFCTSRGCLRHAGIIGLSDATKTPNEKGPCEHFGRFICSAWQTRHERRNVRRRFTQSVKTDAIMESIVSLENFGTYTVLNISKRPARMMDLCLNNRSSDDTESLDTLLNFMRNNGIGFPGDNVSETDYSVPLRAMAELADKWAHPLWFRVNIVLPQNEEMKRVISLSH